MRRTALLASFITFLFVTAATARQSQTPPPTPTPSPTPQSTPTVTIGGRGAGMVTGTVVVDRQTASGQRIAGPPPERMALATFIAPAGPTSWQNVKLDVKISDALNADTQHNKVVSVLCLDGNSSQVRSQSG